jgi:hypothetical protein
VDEIIINKDTKTVYKDADWIHLVQDLYRWYAVVNATMAHRVIQVWEILDYWLNSEKFSPSSYLERQKCS